MLPGWLRLQLMESRNKALKREYFYFQKEALGTDKPFIFRAGGIGSSKSWDASQFLFCEVVHGHLTDARVNPKEPRYYWIAAREYRTARRVFNYLYEELQSEFGSDWHNFLTRQPIQSGEGQWTLHLKSPTGEGKKDEAIVQTVSWTNPESLHAIQLSGLVIDELGGMDDYWTWSDRLLPRGRGMPGFWVFMAGTWEVSGMAMKQMYEEALSKKEWWLTQLIPSWDNTAVYPGGRQDKTILRDEANMPPETFEERYAAIPRKPSGLVYPEFDQKIHCGFYFYESGRDVELWIDPGTGVYAILAVQDMDGFNRAKIIDEVYLKSANTEIAIKECSKRPWWDDVQGGVIDHRAPEAKDLWMKGKIWGKGQGLYLRSQEVEIEPGVEAVKSVLFNQVYSQEEEGPEFQYLSKTGVPKLFFNSSTTPHTQAEFMTFKRNPNTGKPNDKNIHAENAIRYGVVDKYGYMLKKAMKAVPYRAYDPYVELRGGYLK